MMKKMKMLARLTMASATPARLTGLRISMRDQCQGSACGGGVVCLVSMLGACDFGCFLAGGFSFRGFDRGFRDHLAVQSVLVAIVVQRHFSVPPRPVHRIDVRVE